MRRSRGTSDSDGVGMIVWDVGLAWALDGVLVLGFGFDGTGAGCHDILDR
jgi:hypothetical protein